MIADEQRPASGLGPSHTPTLLLVHGSTVTQAMWQPQIEALVGEFHTITLDLPGHGVNAGLPFTMDGAVAQIESTLTTAGRPPVIVVGISLGGYVAIAHAARHPERVAGLILASTTTNFTGVLGAYVRVVGWLLGSVLGEEFQRVRLARSLRRKYPPAVADQLIGAGLYPRAAGQAFGELGGFDALAPLGGLDCPILFVNGANDRASRGGEAAFLAATRHGEAVVLPGAGHLCSLEQPERFTEAVRRFARSWPRRVPATDRPVSGRGSDTSGRAR